jgi:transketolase
MDKNKIQATKNFAADIRIEAIKMMANLGAGHVGGVLSVVDLIAVLYENQMKYDPKNPKMPERDYFIMSKGHCGPAQYAALALKGFFPMEELKTLNRVGTILPSHVDRNKTPGIDMSTGSLGQGVSAALGVALGLKIANKDNTVFSCIGDGEAQEGQVWETFQLAPQLGLDNFIVVMDNNKQQLDNFTCNICNLGDISKKLELFGWFVVDCDGHDVRHSMTQLINAAQPINRLS